MISIPVTDQPNQEFEVVIPLRSDRNIALSFYFSFNDVAQYWEMSVGDASSGQTLISCLPLVTSSPSQNIISQWAYLDIGKAYVVPLTDLATGVPGLNDWGVNYSLLWE
jgi:hypothetical protein